MIINLKYCKYCDGFQDEVSFRGHKCLECLRAYSKKHYVEVGVYRKKDKYHSDPAPKIKYQKEYYKENKEKVEEYRKQYYQENREILIEEQLERDRKKDPEIKAAYQRQYRQDNKEKLKEQRKKRENGSICIKIRKNISNAVYQALRVVGKTKENNSTFRLLGYTPFDLKSHIETQFSASENLTPDGKVWMTWDNWGVYNPETWIDDDYSTHTWHFDHKVPQSEFPIDDVKDENIKKCWSLSNLRPLSAKQNVYDGSNKVRHKIKTKVKNKL